MVTEQIEWLMKWVPPGLNKFSGLAIPQDAGLPGRLMTTGPCDNEVVCLGNVLVNSSVSTSGLAEHNISINPLHSSLLLLLIYVSHPLPQMVWPLSPDPALADHYYPSEIQVTALMGKKWEANQIMGGENGRE